jgi:predicted dienelactone hydrolase
LTRVALAGTTFSMIMPRMCTLSIALFLWACGETSSRAPDTAADTIADANADTTADSASADTPADDTSAPDTSAPDTSAPDSADGQPDSETVSGCAPSNRQACLYRASATYDYQVIEPTGLTYTDITGATRNVNIALYVPAEAPTPMPVVLLSHGGASGKTDPKKSMEHWAPVFAEAGYLAVAIAHEGRDDASYDALCQALAVNTLHPCGVKISWDRPNDVARVLEFLGERAESGQFAGRFDMTRIAHVGHSAGAGAALMSLGATRNYSCALPFGYTDPDQDCQADDLVSKAMDTIDVAIAMSPQGPGSEGFMSESYAAVTRPVLMGTGADDGDEGEPANRMAIFPLLPAGDKFRLYVDDQGAKHTLFEGSTDACEPIVGLQQCTAMRAAIFATGLAFLDAYLRDSSTARAWLASDDLVTAGDGLFTFDRR